MMRPDARLILIVAAVALPFMVLAGCVFQ